MEETIFVKQQDERDEEEAKKLEINTYLRKVKNDFNKRFNQDGKKTIYFKIRDKEGFVMRSSQEKIRCCNEEAIERWDGH